MSDEVLADAGYVAGGDVDVLEAELWASDWLGTAWCGAGISEREPETTLCTEVVGRACSAPSAGRTAAVAAFARVAPAGAQRMLAEALEILSATTPVPAWSGAGWTPVAAWRAVDVWEADRLLFVEYDGHEPHTLMVHVSEVGGRLVESILLLQPGAATAWEGLREPDEVPMPLTPHPVEDVLADLASALETTDRYWPRSAEDDFVTLRALAWSRCRAWLPEPPDFEPMPDEERQRLVDGFVAAGGLPDDGVTRSLAEVFVDFGEGYMNQVLAWSPGWVGTFLSDWLPRKAALDAEQRAALPEALRRWVRYALDRRGVDPEWITPVVEAVDEYLPDFEEAFDDETAWGPAKQVAAALAARGVDLTDHDAVQRAMRELNAENLARRLIDP